VYRRSLHHPTSGQARDISVPLSKIYCTHHVTDSTCTRLAFAIAGLSAWNSLLDPVRNPNFTEAAFRRLLKTFLFARY